MRAGLCKFALLFAFFAFMPKGKAEPMPGLLSTLPATTQTKPLRFSDLPGWAGDDHRAAFEAFLKTCAPVLDGKAALRDARPPSPGLIAACRLARAATIRTSAEARAFFETSFTPIEIRPEGKDGFLTSYFEPEIAASLIETPEFPVPVLARPADLVTFKPGETPPGLPPELATARQGPEGYEPFPDRKAIWAGALGACCDKVDTGLSQKSMREEDDESRMRFHENASCSKGQGLEIAWLKDKADLFIVQVQGSARLSLADGTKTRLVYAGRNGHAYTSIGKILVESGEIPLPEMSLARLMAWLRVDEARGTALMEKNRSYVFFARDDAAPPDQGPIGGAGIPLTEGRSLAVDRTLWPYGLPVYIVTAPLTPQGPRRPLDRLMIAQDTGSAIIGPARGDFYMGSGDAAGEKAGLVRDNMRFILLAPNKDAPENALP